MNAKLILPKHNEINPFIKAEIKTALPIVHHDTFFNLSNHMMQYIKNEFNGSNAVKKISCGIFHLVLWLMEAMMQDLKRCLQSILVYLK